MNDTTDYMKLAAWLLAADKEKLYSAIMKIMANAEEVAEAATTASVQQQVGDGKQHSMEKFLTVGKGVTLVRFAGKGETKLVARRIGTSGNKNTLFEIDVDKQAKVATVFRDERLLFEINGVTVKHSMVEQMAVSALRRWFKNQRKNNAERRRKRKARMLAEAATASGQQKGGAEVAK